MVHAEFPGRRLSGAGEERALACDEDQPRPGPVATEITVPSHLASISPAGDRVRANNSIYLHIYRTYPSPDK